MKTKIMIIEDELRLGHLTATLLQQAGYETVVETNGLRGLQKIKQENPDVILTDVMLPGMTGFEICKKLKKNQIFKHIPVIAITGRTDLDSQKQALKSGADYFIAKPYDLHFLLKIIRSVNHSKVQKKQKKNFLNLKFFGLFFFSLSLLTSTAFASPWVQLPGHSYHELQLGNFQAQDHSFQKSQMQYYFEYGLGSRVSVLGNLFSGNFNAQPFSQGEAGLGVQLLKSDWNSVSLQQWVGNANAINSKIMNQQTLECETRLGIGGSFEKLPVFWTIEPGLHFRNSQNSNEWVLRTSLGLKSKPFELIGEYNQIYSNLQQVAVKFVWLFPENFAAALRLTTDSQSSGATLGVIKSL